MYDCVCVCVCVCLCVCVCIKVASVAVLSAACPYILQLHALLQLQYSFVIACISSAECNIHLLLHAWVR